MVKVSLERKTAAAVRRRVRRGLVAYNRAKAGKANWKRARSRGHGSLLMQAVEREARRRGADLVYLNTFSFQAPRFYEKLGYRRYGVLSGHPRRASRLYYRKELS